MNAHVHIDAIKLMSIVKLGIKIGNILNTNCKKISAFEPAIWKQL